MPMLFLQGTRDALAMLDEIEPMCAALGARATLRLFDDADHSFHVPARSGRTDAQVMRGLLAGRPWQTALGQRPTFPHNGNKARTFSQIS